LQPVEEDQSRLAALVGRWPEISLRYGQLILILGLRRAKKLRPAVGAQHDLGVEHGSEMVELYVVGAAKNPSTTSRCRGPVALGNWCLLANTLAGAACIRLAGRPCG
jgi:hypothetical protein